MKWLVVLSFLGFLSGTVARSITVNITDSHNRLKSCNGLESIGLQSLSVHDLASGNITLLQDSWGSEYSQLYTGNTNTVPNYQTGWTAAPLTSVTFDVPENWNAGRIWGRRNCDFSSNPGPNSCLDGGCVGGLQCTLPGVPPATLAEFTLSSSDGNDYYDVSLVDGYNLPVSITNTAGCHIADCPVDLDPNCPGPLQGPNDSNGYPVGCKSACDADLDGNPTNSANCCTGSYSTPETCPSSGVAYYSYFKGNCPNSYAYAYDESSGSALWTCPSSKAAGYTITFCP